MSRLSLKTVERKNLPWGRFRYIVLLKREAHRVWRCPSNAGAVEGIRTLLRTTCVGGHKLVHEKNNKNRRVYTALYLTEAMDLALIKLTHADDLHKIYRVSVAQTCESP
jgi:hypothetical protein